MNRTSSGLLCLALGASACGGDEGRQVFDIPNENLLEVAQADADLSRFVELLQVAGIETGFSGGTSGTVLTVFAPINSAFTGVDVSMMTSADVSALLRYHMLGGTVDSNLIQFADDVQTITSTVINVRREGTNTVLFNRNGSANITDVDIRARNGIIHKIDAVLIPPTPVMVMGPGNLAEEATAAGLTQLVAAVGTAGLTDTITGAGPLTVFAPTDAAFAALGMINPAADVLANILLTHVVSGSIGSTAVLGASAFRSAAGTDIAVDAGAMPATIGGAPLSGTLDVMASNGIAHVLDGVIVPPTHGAYLASQPNMASLVIAVARASAATQGALEPDTLTGAAPVTLFAPTTDGFAAAMIDVTAADQMTLDTVLSNHVVAGQTLSTGLMDGMMLTTAGGGTLTVNVGMDGAVTVTDGQMNTRNVIQADIRTLNGVIHMVDGPLLP